jgi:hypothetical protein
MIGSVRSHRGNLQIQNLSASANMNQVCGASVHGDLTFQTQNLQCQGNTSISGGGNTAGNKQGQCALY